MGVGLALWLFVSTTIVLGFFMSLGKAAVYKHIPVYYPEMEALHVLKTQTRPSSG